MVIGVEGLDPYRRVDGAVVAEGSTPSTPTGLDGQAGTLMTGCDLGPSPGDDADFGDNLMTGGINSM